MTQRTLDHKPWEPGLFNAQGPIFAGDEIIRPPPRDPVTVEEVVAESEANSFIIRMLIKVKNSNGESQ